MKTILYLWATAFSLMALGQALSLSDPASAIPPSGVAAFSPSDISGLQLWLSADSGAYSDAGTTSCNDGDSVYRWSDLSGNARHFDQTNSSARPTYKTGIVNSKPVIRFDGTSDYLYWTNIFTTNFTSACAFVVLKLRNDPTTNTLSCGFWDFGGDGVDATHFVYTNGDIWDDFGSVRRQVGNPAFSMTNWTLYNVETASGNFTARINTTNQYTSGANTVQWETTKSVVAFGTSEPSGSYFIDADVAELIVYNSVLSTANRSNINVYLDNKYSLAY